LLQFTQTLISLHNAWLRFAICSRLLVYKVARHINNMRFRFRLHMTVVRLYYIDYNISILLCSSFHFYATYIPYFCRYICIWTVSLLSMDT
jgi:hypothetical protein